MDHRRHALEASLLGLALVGCGARSELDTADAGATADGSADSGVTGDALPPTSCRVSAPTVLFPDTSADYIAVDDTSVYWTNGGSVHAIDKSGQNARLLGKVATSAGYPTGLAVAGGYVYWGEWYGDRIVRAPSGTPGASEVLATNQRDPFDVAVIGGDVYWANYHGGDIAGWSPSDTAPKDLATGPGGYTSIATDGTSIFFTEQANTLYSGTVFRDDPSSGPAVALASDRPGAPWWTVVSATTVYWVEYPHTGFDVAAVPKTGGAVTVLATVPFDPTRCGTSPSRCSWSTNPIATDGAFVYFVLTAPDGFVGKVPEGGGPTTIIADHLHDPAGVVVDENCAYWTSADGVMLGPK